MKWLEICREKEKSEWLLFRLLWTSMEHVQRVAGETGRIGKGETFETSAISLLLKAVFYVFLHIN